MQKSTLSLLISLSLISFSSITLAADKEYCQSYARALINLPHNNKSKDTLEVCKVNQPHWSNDKAAHLQWCLSVSEAEADKKLYSHNKLVNLCNDTYKLIMLERKRCANLPLSASDPIDMQPASEAIKAALFSSTKAASPYSKLYPEVEKASKSLAKCEPHSLAVDIDKNPESKEWVVSTSANCLTDNKSPHIWLIQKIGERHNILFEGKDSTLTIRYKETDGYKNITIASQLSSNEETEKRCGSIITDWHFVEGRYLPVEGKADVHGSCLPNYDLPDRLQGANTYDLAEGEWEKEMAKQEAARVTLHAPYQQALQDYIPEWISKTTKLISAAVPAHSNKSQVYRNVDGDTQFKETELETKEDKSFMKNVKSFLGLD